MAPRRLPPTGKPVNLTIKGTNLSPDATVTISGSDVTVVKTPGATATSTTFPITVTVATTAQPGTRTLTLTNLNCAFATHQVTIRGAQT